MALLFLRDQTHKNFKSELPKYLDMESSWTLMYFFEVFFFFNASQVVLVVENLSASAGDV